MSLINQVLKDLEQRQVAEAGEGATILQHVRYVPAPNTGSRNWLILKWIVVVALIVAAATGIYLWRNHAVNIPAQQTNLITPVAVISQPISSQVAPASIPATVPEMKESMSAAPPTVSGQPEVPIHASRHRKSNQPQVAAQSQEEVESSGASEPMLVQKHPVLPSATEQLAINYQQAYELIAQQRWREAESQLRESLKQDATQHRLRELLVGLYIKTGRWIEADAVLAQGLKLLPVQPSLVKLRARTLMQLNQDKQAIAVLTQFAPPPSVDPEHYALMAVLQQRLGQHAQAVNIYQQLLAKNPNVGVWWVGMGISLEAQHQQGAAKTAFEHARASGNLSLEVARYTDNRLRVLQETGLSTTD